MGNCWNVAKQLKKKSNACYAGNGLDPATCGDPAMMAKACGQD